MTVDVRLCVRVLCITWLNPNVLALPGFCIAVPLLCVLKCDYFKK
jgi:hypothetical protein